MAATKKSKATEKTPEEVRSEEILQIGSAAEELLASDFFTTVTETVVKEANAELENLSSGSVDLFQSLARRKEAVRGLRDRIYQFAQAGIKERERIAGTQRKGRLA